MGRPSSPLKNPAPCFDWLSMSGSLMDFKELFPLTLSLSKGPSVFFNGLLGYERGLYKM